MKKYSPLFLLIIIALLIISNAAAAASKLPLQEIKLPPGFHISVYARNVPGARQMALAKDGTVFVGSRREGKVYALLHEGKDYNHASKVVTLASGLNNPNGVAVYKGNLYVAETNRVLRYSNILQHLLRPPRPTVITNKLPSKSHHGFRYIKFGPNGWLYMGIGAPCNVCVNKNPIFATIIRMKPDGSNRQIYAKGIRNTVGFAWYPKTKQLWLTDNGRDWLGDNLPPDELNIAPHAGMNFGFPYFYGDNVRDPDFGRGRSSKGYTPPVLDLPAHVAALGMVFYTGHLFPKAYDNQIFIAEHGSWNRSRKVGYQVVLVKLSNGHPLGDTPFATGWLQGQKYWGRPVDLLVLPDGSLLVSDDYAGAIYRISYE